MATRRVSVEFIAELAGFRRATREGANDVRRLKDESKAAQVEVGNLGRESERAGQQVSRSMADAAGRMRDNRGRFAAAGADSGRAFGDGFTRDAQGRLRDARGRFVAEGERLGESASQGLRRGAKKGGGGNLFGDFAGIAAGGRALGLVAAGAGAAVAGLQVIPPVLGAIAGGLAALPGLAAGALGSIGTLSLGTSGIGKAVGEVFNPRPSGGGGGGGGGGADQAAANERRLESAERSLARAQRDSRLAQIEVTQARREATRELRDMGIAMGRITLDERDAALTLRESKAELDALNAKKSINPLSVSDTEMERAQLAVDQAQQAITETSARAQDLKLDYAAASKAGVEGSDQVQGALRRQHDAAEAVIEAQNGVLDAQAAMNKAAGGGGGAAAQATAYDKLSKNAKLFVDEIARLKPQLVGLQQLAQNRIFAGLDKELASTAKVAIPFARTQIKRFGDTWNDTFTQLLQLGRNRDFLSGLDAAFGSADGFFDKINARIPATGKMLGQLFTSSVPFVDEFGNSLLQYVDDFNSWIDRASNSGALDSFFADAAKQASALLDIGREVLVLVGKIGGMGQGSTVLRDMADALQKFNDNAHNMSDVQGIIDTGNAAIKGIVDVLLILGKVLGETLADPGTKDAVVVFFEVVKAGAKAVADLLAVFQTLPDWFQSAALATVALTIVGGRLFGTLGRMQEGADKFAKKLGELGPAGEKAGKGVTGLTRGLGFALNALVAWEVANTIWDQFEAAPASIDKLTKSLKELGDTGKSAGELARVFGSGGWLGQDGLAQFGVDLNVTGSSVSSFGRQVESMIPWARKAMELTWGSSWSKAKEDIDGVDQALAAMVQSGDAEGAQAAFDRLAESAAKQGKSVDEVRAALPKYGSAVKDVGAESETAAQKTERLKRAFDDLFGVELDLDRATIAAKQGLKDLHAELTTGKVTLDTNTQAGRDNATAVLDQIEKFKTLRQARIDHNMELDVANGKYVKDIDGLRATLLQMGYLPAAVDALIAKYKAIPEKVDTDVNLNGPTRAEINGVNQRLKEITKRIDVKAVLTASYGGSAHTGSGYSTGNRWGGVYEHAATGLLRESAIYSARNPGRYMIAEPPTGGELFAPKNGDLARTKSMVDYAVKNWWGGNGVDWGGKSGSASNVMTISSMAQTGYRPAAPATSGGDSGPTIIENHIEIGGEVVRVVRTEVNEANRNLKRNVTSGSGTRR